MTTRMALVRHPAPATKRANDRIIPVAGTLTAGQMAAIHAVMELFVEDDLARGISPLAELYCRACQRGRPLPGFVLYEHYQLCNACATEYEVAQARGRVASAGQFVGEQAFGGGPAYPLDEG